MNIKGLRLFSAVMHHGSLKVAADLMATSESAASRQIKNLEDTLNLTLFDRGPRNLVPTIHAIQLHEEVTRALNIINGLPELSKSLRETNREVVRVVSIFRIARSLVAPAIADIMKSDPGFQINFDVKNMRNVKHWISTLQYDLAVGRDTVDHPELVKIPFCQTRPWVLVGKEHPLASESKPITFKQLSHFEYVSTSLDNTLLGKDIEEMMENTGVSLKPAMETMSTYTSSIVVENNFGFTITDTFGTKMLGGDNLVALPIESDYLFKYAFYINKSKQDRESIKFIMSRLRAATEGLDNL